MKKVLFLLLALVAVSGLISPPVALVAGLITAFTFGNPFLTESNNFSKKLLQFSVVGLGFGLNINTVVETGKSGFVFTLVTVVSTMLVGMFLGKFLKTEKDTSVLLSSGTAICGGSAIAAIAPVIAANPASISVSLAIVFVLNSVGLIIFPVLGHLLHLSQSQFGMWSAIAIHDTSSVVGAASRFGDEALHVATTVKLTRALWIIPLTIAFSALQKRTNAKPAIPWFIGFFILATLLTTLFPQFTQEYHYIKEAAKHGLTLTLFLIGATLSTKDLKTIGYKPFIQAVLMWVFIASFSLAVILWTVR